MKIICYGVRPIEKPYFEKLNKYSFDLKLVEEYLTADNGNLAVGMDAVLLRGNCLADRKNLELFSSYGIKYVFTRTVGFNHIDLKAAKDLDILVARVPNYSPYAVAELALTLGMQLFRHVNIATTNSSEGNFTVVPELFSKQVHTSTVGIIGLGKIGFTEAKLYKGLGAKILAYDPYPFDAAKEVVDYVELDELLEKSDIVSIHVPYFPGQNENLINSDSFKKMKKTAVFVNTARGELVDTAAVVEAFKSGQISGYGADVVINEKEIMNHDLGSVDNIPNPDVKALTALYPKAILTPHMGSFTEPALEDMISISFDNFEETIKTGANCNIISYQEK
ncbi:D-lactate dehydrogenase [Lactobacillus colini]|uniref:D-lactate dehydrogenase n=1 Tax=Lactobacillus colini TaxID=1819254 RepID=A0ABS4MBQ2_9LACO|nr:NAD(P)-dependent oxidoreductase [Lactobacillus colini]MBP2057108.1 D-lactate dehydrogenase [Lactobacillus colini]